VEDEGDKLGVLGVGFRRVSGKRTAGGDAASASRSEAGSRTRREPGASSSKSDSGPRLPAGAMSVDRGKSTGIGLGRATRSTTRLVAKRAAEIEASLIPTPTPPVGSGKPRLLSHVSTANGRPGGVSRVGAVTEALNAAGAPRARPNAGSAAGSASSVPGNPRRPIGPPSSPQLPKYNTRSKLPLPSAGALGPTTTTTGGLKVPQKRGAYVLSPPPPLPLPLPAEKGKKQEEEEKEKEDEVPDWMHSEGASAVVVPGSKSERPNLRSVRRRRSSFSAADVVT